MKQSQPQNVSCFLVDVYGYVVYSGRQENVSFSTINNFT